jgi:integrase
MSNIEQFLAGQAGILAESTLRTYRARLAVFAEFAGTQSVNSLLCKSFLGHLLNSGRGRRTAATYYTTLHILYEWLREAGIVDANPVPKLKHFAIPSIERQTITLEDVTKLLERAKTDGRGDWTYAILCAWETGLRLGDVATLRWREVNVADQVIRRIPIKTRRFGKTVEIPISPELLQAMRKTPPYVEGDSSFVCPGMAQKYLYDQHRTLSAEFIRLARKAGVNKSIHCIRHGRVSHLLNKGVPIAVVRSITGQSLKVLQGYSHGADLETKRVALA